MTNLRRFALSMGIDKAQMSATRNCFSENYPGTIVVDSSDRIDALIKMSRQQFDVLVCEISSTESEGYSLIHAFHKEDERVKPKSTLMLCNAKRFPELTIMLGDSVNFLPLPCTMEQLKNGIKKSFHIAEKYDRSNPEQRSKQQNAKTKESSHIISIVLDQISANGSQLGLEISGHRINKTREEKNSNLILFPFQTDICKGQLSFCFPLDKKKSLDLIVKNLSTILNEVRTGILPINLKLGKPAVITGDVSVFSDKTAHAIYSFEVLAKESNIIVEITIE